jgi:hypothetical protein
MLSKFRSCRPGHGTVIAYIALFIALGGSSYGLATGSIDSREITNNTIRSGDIRDNHVGSRDVRNFSLLEKDFKRGELPQGPPGPTGPIGPAGPTGSSAASAFTARISDAPSFAPSQYFGAVSGISSGTSDNDDAVTTRSPNATIIARDLSVRYGEPLFVSGNAGWRISLLVNGASTSLACEIRGTATTCNSGDAAVNVPPGSELAFKAESIPDNGFVPNDPDLEIGWRATTP